MSTPRPPRRLEDWLARLLAGVPGADATLGDLAEGFAARERTAGRRAARRWYLRQCLSLLLHRRQLAPRTPRHAGSSGVGERLTGDLRQAARAARRSPAHALLVWCLLTLAIGTTTAALTVTVGTMAAARWWEDEARTVFVWPETRFSRGQLEVLRTESSAFETVGGILRRPLLLAAAQEPQSVAGVVLSPELFQALRAKVGRGRGLEPRDAMPGAEPVVVLGHGLWMRAFGGASTALGLIVEVSGVDRRVIGVMPPGVRQPGPGTEAWIPLILDAADPDFWPARDLEVVAIRRAGVDDLTALRDVRRVLGDLARRFAFFFRPDFGSRATVVPAAGRTWDAVATPLLLLLAGTFLLLVIAAIDVANLALARSLERRTELRVRAAVGATRAQIVRQLAAEAAVLVLPAAVAGWGLGALVAGVLPGLFPSGTPVTAAAPGAPAVLLWVVGVSLLTWLLMTSIPALHFLATSRVELTPRRGRRRAARGLVVAQATLSTALLITAALLVRTVHSLAHVPLGFAPAGVTAVPVAPSAGSVSGAALDGLRAAVAGSLVGRPGLASAGWISAVPFKDPALNGPVQAEEAPVPVAAAPTPLRIVADGGALDALGVRLVTGRSFTAADDASAPPVALVSVSLARLLWGDADPVGRRMAVDPHAWDAWVRVLGVVEDVRHADLTTAPPPAFFLPPAQAYTQVMTLLVRAQANTPDVAAAVREELALRAPHMAVGSGHPLTDLVRDAQGQARVLTALLGILAVVATVLGAAGLHGALAGWVARRRAEFGTRLALGATPTRLSAGVLLTALLLTGRGVILGSAVAAVAARGIRSLLFGTSPLDPLAYAATALLLLLTALLAAAVPAFRAATVAPALALRESS
jgi:predicted permease